MDGSDHRKLYVIGKAKNPRCLQKKYKMTVKEMAVDWYASKNASRHQVQEYSHIKFLMLPPNATLIVQPLDQGIIRSVNRQYKKKLAERYLVSVENNKDANTILKQLDIVAATNMVHNAGKKPVQLSSRIAFVRHGSNTTMLIQIQHLRSHLLSQPDVSNKVQRWMGDVQFDDSVVSEPEVPTTQPMTDEEIIKLICTENDAPQEESDDEEDEAPPVKLIKTTNEFLAIIDQQKAFMKRNKLPIKLVKQLQTLIVGNQISLCSKQKEVTGYFKSFTQSPNPKDVYKTVADVSRDITIVDLLADSTLEVDSIEFESINTTIALGAMNALLRNEVTP